MAGVFDLGSLSRVREYIEFREGKLKPDVAAHIDYTMRHKKAILILDNYYGNKYGRAGYNRLLDHDLDKVFMYGVIKNNKQAHEYHVNSSIHHYENWIPGDLFARYETVLDYESARYTKPDKPLNAYSTIEKFRPQAMAELKPVLIELDINSPINKDIAGPALTLVQEEELYRFAIEKISTFYGLYNSGMSINQILLEFNRVWM